MAIDVKGWSTGPIADYPELPAAVEEILEDSTFSSNTPDHLGSMTLPSKREDALTSVPGFEGLPSRPGVVVEATVVIDPLRAEERTLFLTMLQVGQRVALVVGHRVVAVRELATSGQGEDDVPHYKDLVLRIGRGSFPQQNGVTVASGRGMGPSRMASTPISHQVKEDMLVSITLPADMNQNHRLSRGVSSKENGGQLALRWALRPINGIGGEASTLWLNSDPETPPAQATYPTEVSVHAFSEQEAAVVEAWMSPLFEAAPERG